MLIVSLGVTMAILCGCDPDQASCEHDFAVWYPSVAPTCEEDGEEISTCTICGKRESRAVGKLNHDWQIVSDTTGCLTGGEIVYVCNNDRSHTYREEKGPLGHQWKAGDVIVAATCTQQGRNAPDICERCGAVSEFEVIVPPLNHDFGESVVTQAATCTADGSATKTCRREGCGYTETVSLPKTGHDYVEESRKDAACTENGSIHYVCSHDRNHTKDDVIQATGHDWEADVVTKAATCTTPGEAASGRCRRCNITQDNVTIPALGHDFQRNENLSEAATCEKAGKDVLECSRCHEQQTTEIPQKQHNFMTFYGDPPTCQKQGYNKLVCQICHHEERQILEKVPCDLSLISYITPPTCTQPGTMVYCCKYFCGKQSDVCEAPPKGHDWKELEIILLPTCQADGKAKHQCLVCGENEEYTLPKTGHVYSEYLIDRPSSATSKGEKAKHCIYCGEKGDVETFEQNGEEIEYEIRLRRTNGFEYSFHDKTGFENLVYKVYCGDRLIETIKVENVTEIHRIPKTATHIIVEGLDRGFRSVYDRYELDPSKPIVTIEVTASVIQTNLTADKYANQPESKLFLGDAMFDFMVNDVRHPERKQLLSELMEGKKLILLDFFHVACSNCTTYMGYFQQAYEKTLYAYRNDILVLMLDIQEDSEEQIKAYCTSHRISDDFIVCSVRKIANRILQWFDSRDGVLVQTPGHVWLDDQGVIYDMKVKVSVEKFDTFVKDYFNKFNIGEAEHKFLEERKGQEKINRLPVSPESLCLPQQSLYGNKRKYGV